LINVSEGSPMFIWEPAQEHGTSKTANARALLKQREEEEFRRLLYVGMTRAEDQLIVCGFGTTHTKADATSWVNMVKRGLGEGAHSSLHPHYGGEILVWQTGTGKTPAPEDAPASDVALEPLPPDLRSALAPVRLLPRPLSPSGASLAIEPQASAGAASPVLDRDESQPSDAILRGLITHKLLESLPGLPPESRRDIAARYVNKAAADWEDARKASVVTNVLRVLADMRFQPAFSEGSRAEVSVMGEVKVRGETRMVSGKIDRIAVAADRVLLVDFKTDHAPASSASDVPTAYLAQMALYRAIVQPLYPDKTVECALLYTGGAKLIGLPPERMDAALEALANS
jgi:ATP-dependent helicase/nuclease subunit A